MHMNTSVSNGSMDNSFGQYNEVLISTNGMGMDHTYHCPNEAVSQTEVPVPCVLSLGTVPTKQ